MRRIVGTILLTIPLTILITLLALNLILKDMMGDIIGSTWKSFIPSISYKEGNFFDQFKEYVNEAFEDEEVEEIFGQLQEEFGEDGNTIQEFIDQNKSKIEEITGLDLNTETIESIKKAIEEKNYGELFEQIIETQEQKLTPGQKFALKCLKFIVTARTRGILIVCIIINIILIALVQFSLYKWIKALAWATAISGGLLFGFSYGFSAFLEKMGMTISIEPIMKPAIIMIIVGIVVRILYLVIGIILKNLKDNKKEEKEEKKKDKKVEDKEDE